MAKATMFFPDDFLWGTATAAYQVEGNVTNSDWWQWEQQPDAILHNHKSGQACDWWQNAEADLDRAATMGTNAHRLSLEWSRIEPEKGRFDQDALDRYRAILTHMHNVGIEPMVTLHHFSNPLWLVAEGDFNNGDVATLFQRYAAKVVAELGDLIPKWVTLNEPLVYIVLRYLEEAFPPPHQRGWRTGMKALVNLLRCHAVAYHAIKRKYPLAQVGVAKHFRPIRRVAHDIHAPTGGTLAQRYAQRLAYIFNDLWMDALVDGKLRLPAGRGTLPHLSGTFDFVGINYYTYSNVNWPPNLRKLYSDSYPENAIVGDGNYGEVYPSGLYKAIQWGLRYNKPIFITENGMPDDDDDQRPAFILNHLREVWRAISFNYPIMGYYHWSLIDNFEWERGWTQRFGLIALNTETGERTLRDSGKLYSEICHSNSVTDAMAEKYAPQLLTTLFHG